MLLHADNKFLADQDKIEPVEATETPSKLIKKTRLNCSFSLTIS